MGPTGIAEETLAVLRRESSSRRQREVYRCLPGLEDCLPTGPRETGGHSDPSGRIDCLREDGTRARSRLRDDTPPAMRRHLTEFARIGALAHAAVGLFAYPERAGGFSLDGPVYRARLERYDPTVLHEYLTAARLILDRILADVERQIEDTPPTAIRGGSTIEARRAKVGVLSERFDRGQALFVEGDAA